MATYFSEILDEIKLLANNELEGYDSEEISQIERLYDISVDKDFKSFLELAGKCSGGVIGDQSLVFYHYAANIGFHLANQEDCRNQLRELGLLEIVELKPFFFALESEYLYYFLQTVSEDNQKVYSYNEDDNIVEETDMYFSDYIKREILGTRRINSVYKHKRSPIWKGNILAF